MLIAIVAHDENRVIAKDGKIPWKIKEDLKLFRQITTGHSTIMGRKTWESIPEKYRPLPNRTNIVLTKDLNSFAIKPVPSSSDNIGRLIGSKHKQQENTWFTTKWDSAIEIAKKYRPGKHIFIIGGASIYDYAINEAKIDRILLSLVDGEHEGDVFFPELDENEWMEKSISLHEGFELIEKIRYETCI